MRTATRISWANLNVNLQPRLLKEEDEEEKKERGDRKNILGEKESREERKGPSTEAEAY